MIRLATEQDIPWMVDQHIQLLQRTAWKELCDHQLADYPYNADVLTPFFVEQLRSARSVCYVWDDPMDAFCAVSSGRLHVPPHLPYVFEWGWVGPPRHAVACWNACLAWAKKRGHILACRSASIPGSVLRETLTWEKL